MSLLFALGSNGSGQIGIGHLDDTSVPTLVPNASGQTVSNIVAGGNHSALLLETGSLTTTGENEDGRCFAVNRDKSHRFELLSPVADGVLPQAFYVHITATWSATIAVRSDGKLLAAGSGNVGELGLGPHTTLSNDPQSIEAFPSDGTNIVKLASGMAHVVAVLSNGEVWGWGQGRKGQLGQPSEIVWTPRKILNIGFFATNAVCGKDFTCIFGQPGTGELVVMRAQGRDRFGIRAGAPKAVPGWKQVAASWGSVFVLSQSGNLVCWGRNDRGQLPPQNLPQLESIAAGSEHCLGLSKAGQVLAWGWGEHGNCGQPIDSDGDVKGRWNELHLAYPVSALFAGCATTFIVAQSGTLGK